MKVNGEIPGMRPSTGTSAGTPKADRERAESSFSDALGAAISSTQLTSKGKLANATQESLAGVPAVNEARVAAIRTAISEGRYAIDLNAVAEKMLQLEQDL